VADKSLSAEEAKFLLSTRAKGKGGPPTEPRTLAVWFKLDHVLWDDGCSNPNCVDNTRPRSDPGRRIVIKLDGEYVCRECFLHGWLSNATTQG